ncbi:MAG: helix-turn-helix transcriptional regulator [Pleurocapsa sp. SU_196_0]|nr:helix-turn-helix transcriptional regulator [Pleurocapsa sp. SU_196_0]
MKSLVPTTPLETLTHHRWAIPIIALLHAGRGAKFVTVANTLHLSRDALTRSLTALLEADWAMRNPGYGHPLRPEYILTTRGARIGAACAELTTWLETHELQEPMLKKWSLPVTLALFGHTRFSKLQRALVGITPRALTLTLDELQTHGLVTREGRDYALSETGLEVSTLAARLETLL